MKKIITHPVFYVCSWFVAVTIFATLVSCSSYVHCDAYGKNDSKPLHLGDGIKVSIKNAATEEIATIK